MAYSRTRRRKTSRAGNTLRLALVVAVLIGVNVYVLFFGSGSLKHVQQAARDAVAEAGTTIPAPALPVASPAPQKPRSITGKVRDGESLGGVLRREKLRADDSDATLRALGPVMDFRKEIQSGQKYSIQLDDSGRLTRLELRTAKGPAYVVARDANGNLVAREGRTPQH
jgi:cell envelope opacity-associated protein A